MMMMRREFLVLMNELPMGLNLSLQLTGCQLKHVPEGVVLLTAMER